eukprot:TRINITY_DN42131_c0_g1_i1.p1 TRINITY_DN42131_c0_g1~~TRINITY_DN42131_c0_g1_i1.p1  ORF type:complete len:550 (+),score=29.34 TRINITY_DN42131_c0_g1_i1:73-1722(+)
MSGMGRLLLGWCMQLASVSYASEYISSEVCASGNVCYAQDAHRVRNDLLAGLDAFTPPISQRKRAQGKPGEASLGTDVYVYIKWFNVDHISVKDGTLSAKVVVGANWQDDRLAWNETAYGGIKKVKVRPDMFEYAKDGNLWTPDLHIYSSRTPVSQSLNHAVGPDVRSSGSVYWIRPGMLDVFCKFSGLVNFPHDELICVLELGSWDWTEEVMNLEFDPATGGSILESDEESFGQVYSEYRITQVDTKRQVFYYPCCPDDGWPILTYTLHIKRSRFYYFLNMEAMQIVFVMLSFVVFWLPDGDGATATFAMTIVLTLEVTKLFLLERLPVCGELLWIEIFNFMNTFFAWLSLLSSCVNWVLIATGRRDTAARVDYAARLTIPALYGICLELLYHFNLQDDYNLPGSVMFQGLAPHWFIKNYGGVGPFLAIVGAVFLAALRFACRGRNGRDGMRQETRTTREEQEVVVPAPEAVPQSKAARMEVAPMFDAELEQFIKDILRMPELRQSFQDQGVVSLEILEELTSEDFDRLGLSVGVRATIRKRLLYVAM